MLNKLKEIIQESFLREDYKKKDLLILSYSNSFTRLKNTLLIKRYYQSFLSYNVCPFFFILSGCEYHIWYSHPVDYVNYAKHNRKRK